MVVSEFGLSIFICMVVTAISTRPTDWRVVETYFFEDFKNYLTIINPASDNICETVENMTTSRMDTISFKGLEDKLDYVCQYELGDLHNLPKPQVVLVKTNVNEADTEMKLVKIEDQPVNCSGEVDGIHYSYFRKGFEKVREADAEYNTFKYMYQLWLDEDNPINTTLDIPVVYPYEITALIDSNITYI